MAYWIAKLETGPQRVNHAATVIGHKIYSFGGYCASEDYKSFRPIDVHALDIHTLRWTFIYKSEWKVPEVPFQRYGHSVVSFNKKAYLWGGRNDITSCCVLYIFDSNTQQWQLPVTTGEIPMARDGHAATLVDYYMYIFGGYEDEFESFSQALFRLNLHTLHWEHVITKGIPPSWRDFHSAATIRRDIYIFGGRGDLSGSQDTQNEIYFNKIVYFNTQSGEWITPTTKGDLPIGRRSHSSFVHQDKLYIFGGYNSLIDTHFNDLFCYDPKIMKWSKVTVHGTCAPCPRRRQCACIVDSRVYIFGGTSPDPSIRGEPHLNNFSALTGNDSMLRDHVDLYVLDLQPMLKTLCMLEVIKHELDISFLPRTLQKEIRLISSSPPFPRSLTNMG